jgi:hypothetical protein
MNSEQISLIATEPFIQRFVLAIIENIREKNFSYEKKSVIHADLVPKISEKVMYASLGERVSERVVEPPRKIIIPPKNIVVPPKKIIIPPRKIVASANISPIVVVPVVEDVSVRSESLFSHNDISSKLGVGAPISPANVSAVQIKSPQTAMPVRVSETNEVEDGQGYGKISLLLEDSSVASIECQGAGKSVMVTRAGQRQPTRIVLSAGEIRDVLDRISDMAHIPLLEGVFRAAVDGFSVNAVISEIVGSRFVIRKSQ